MSVRQLLKLVVNDTIVRVLSQQEKGVPVITLVATGLSSILPQWQQAIQKNETGLSNLAVAAFRELEDVVGFLLMLLKKRTPETSVLDSVMCSSKGCREWVRNSLASHPYWQKQEEQARATVASLQTLKPEIDHAMKQLPEYSLEEIRDRVAPRIQVWEEGLPEGLSCWAPCTKKAQPVEIQCHEVETGILVLTQSLEDLAFCTRVKMNNL